MKIVNYEHYFTKDLAKYMWSHTKASPDHVNTLIIQQDAKKQTSLQASAASFKKRSHIFKFFLQSYSRRIYTGIFFGNIVLNIYFLQKRFSLRKEGLL